MLPALLSTLTVVGYDWSSADVSGITDVATGLSTTMGPVVITITGLVIGFKLFKRFANKI